MKKPYTLIYSPACCPKQIKGEPCAHEQHEMAYHADSLKDVIEAKGRVGGDIFKREGEELVKLISY